MAQIVKHPEIFWEVTLDFSPGWEDNLKQQIATALEKYPDCGLETFIQMVLDIPAPQKMLGNDTDPDEVTGRNSPRY